MADQTSKLSASQVLDALCVRWPDSEYIHVREAPNDPMRQGRKLDLLVVSCWASRGHELDGVEVKVSASDWKRELDNPAKADWWVEHVHRFWIAVPAELAPKVKAELPTGWGLLAVSQIGGKPKVAVKPERRIPKPMDWATTVGLMRASADAGFGALQRAEQRGYSTGREAGVREGKRSVDHTQVNRRHEELLATVKAFEEASGIKLTDRWTMDAEETGAAVRALMHYRTRPGRLVDETRRQADAMRARAKDVAALADALAEALIPAEVGQLPLASGGES